MWSLFKWTCHFYNYVFTYLSSVYGQIGAKNCIAILKGGWCTISMLSVKNPSTNILEIEPETSVRYKIVFFFFYKLLSMAHLYNYIYLYMYNTTKKFLDQLPITEQDFYLMRNFEFFLSHATKFLLCDRWKTFWL